MPYYAFNVLYLTGIGTRELLALNKIYHHNEMKRGCKASGVNKIRNHDLRHSHCSLLIELGFPVIAIAERLGHESIDITYRYAHLFPNKQNEIAERLNLERVGSTDGQLWAGGETYV